MRKKFHIKVSIIRLRRYFFKLAWNDSPWENKKYEEKNSWISDLSNFDLSMNKNHIYSRTKSQRFVSFNGCIMQEENPYKDSKVYFRSHVWHITKSVTPSERTSQVDQYIYRYTYHVCTFRIRPSFRFRKKYMYASVYTYLYMHIDAVIAQIEKGREKKGHLSRISKSIKNKNKKYEVNASKINLVSLVRKRKKNL